MSDLQLIRLVLDTRALLAFARDQRLLHRETDQGYLVHAGLAAVFGARAPGPFAIEHEVDPRKPIDPAATHVLAYSRDPFEELRAQAAEPHRYLVDWNRCEWRPVPVVAAGRTLAFATRVVPTVRSRAGSAEHPAHGRGHGREVDAFIAACARAGNAPVDRAAVYREWLARELGRPMGGKPAAELADYSLSGFTREPLLRKEQGPSGEGRKRHVLERPCATITGTLRVTDADAFRALLARGLGRHRAFGFGMLLLRRPS